MPVGVRTDPYLSFKQKPRQKKYEKVVLTITSINCRR
jgi:hypothetical protein